MNKIFGTILFFNNGRDKNGKIIRLGIPAITREKSKAEAIKEFNRVRNKERRKLKTITKSFAPQPKEFNSFTEAKRFYTKNGWKF